MIVVGSRVVCDYRDSVQPLEGKTHTVIGFDSDGWACINNVKRGHDGTNPDAIYLYDHLGKVVKDDPRDGSEEFYFSPIKHLKVINDNILPNALIKYIINECKV